LKTTRPFFFLAGVFFPLEALLAQPQGASPENIFALLQAYKPLHVTIETDIKRLKNGKADEAWQPGVFKARQGDSTVLRLDIQLAARGQMRKNNCDFPPAKIRFYDEKSVGDSLASINELKIVTACDKSSLDEEWVQRECVLYELYNLVTEQSFRVKAANVRFEDPARKNAFENFSFFIESEKALSARLGGLPLKPKIGSIRNLDSLAYDRMAMFQFMIGNTDWSIRGRHNIKLIYLFGRAPNSPAVVPVAYDFDYAGAVSASYAVPSDKVPIKTVQERYYLGACRYSAHYQRVFDFYLSKKQALLDHCEQSPHLSKASKKQMVGYLKEFFDILSSPSRAQREIAQSCRE
jgi:hypothetical protein